MTVLEHGPTGVWNDERMAVHGRAGAARRRRSPLRALTDALPRSPLRRLLGVIALLSLAAGVAVSTGRESSYERHFASDLTRLRHLRIPPRATPPSGSSARRVATREPIVGTNDGAGWGRAAARTILRARITWNRVELGSFQNTLAQSLSDGFKVLAIVNNVADGTPLSQVEPARWGAEVVSQLEGDRGAGIAEAGNESYLKGGVANPVQYGRMYLAAVEDMNAAGIHTPLLFNMTGDIPSNTWADPGAWSEDAHGGGWLREAVDGVPGLAAAILANGISIHPYGALREDNRDDWGIGAAAADEQVAETVLGSIPPFYVTEIGYALDDCGNTIGACSPSEQASRMQAAYEVLLADPHIAGIWWYQSHDDPTGEYGFMDNNDALRPAFKVLAALGTAVGQ
jgi:hypothetical protein